MKGISSSPIRAPPAVKCRRILRGHYGKVTSMQWAGDSETVVSAGQDGNLLVWNALTANKLQVISLKSSYVMSVAIEQSRANLVACGGLDNLCTIYRRSKPSQAMEMASHDGFLSCCRFVSENEIITSSGDSTCIQWDILSGKPVATFAEHKADALFVSLKPEDPSVFASCSIDQTVKIWDSRAPARSQQTFRGFESDVNCVQFMPSDGNCFAACCQDTTIRLFDLRSYNELSKFGGTGTVPTSGADSELVSDGLTSLDFSRSGRLVFAGNSEGTVVCFDVLSERSNHPAYTLSSAHDRKISSLGMSPMGSALCTASWDGTLKVWA